MESPENRMDDNKTIASTSVEFLKQGDSQNTPSTSRYGRARKPKSYFKDYYNTDEVIKNPQKRGTKSISPKMQSPNSRKKSKSDDDFVHVTGDADIFTAPPIHPLAETTEDNFENFVKSVSEQVEIAPPADTSAKEGEIFKTSQECKLEASTVSQTSKVALTGAVKSIELATEIETTSKELIEPELDVKNVIKIVTKPTDVIEQTADAQKTKLKTYGNKRKSVQKASTFETFGLPDKPFIHPKDLPIDQTKTCDIDAVINTSDTNQITIDTSGKNSNTTTFFGIKLSPEKPRESIGDPKIKPPLKNLITSVTRIGKVQPTVTKIKSVLSSDSAKKIFASVSKQNTITIVPKAGNNAPNVERQQSPLNEGNLVGDIPTCKIKSITSMTVSDPKNVNNNNQEKKFVKLVMDKSKILKVLPTSGGSPLKLHDSANSSATSDSDKSFTSPSFSPLKPIIAAIKKVPSPSVVQIPTVCKTNLLTTSSSSTPKLVRASSTSPRIIASSKLIRKHSLSPISPVKIVNLPPALVLSSAGETIVRKRKQELILRKDIDHSYSISSTNLPIAPKKKFIAQMKIVDVKLDDRNKGDETIVVEETLKHDKLIDEIGKIKADETVVVKATLKGDKIGEIKADDTVVVEATLKGDKIGEIKADDTVVVEATLKGDKIGEIKADYTVVVEATLKGDKLIDKIGEIKADDTVVAKATLKGKLIDKIGEIKADKTVVAKATLKGKLIDKIGEIKADDTVVVEATLKGDKLIDQKKIDEELIKLSEEKLILSENKAEIKCGELKSEAVEVESKTAETKKDDLNPKNRFADLNLSPVVRLESMRLSEGNKVETAIELLPENVVNKPLDNVSKTVVRVSPRKGKGTNAFLWETNTRAFFIKQNIKGKMPDILPREDADQKEEPAVELIDLKEEIVAEKDSRESGECVEIKEAVRNKKVVGTIKKIKTVAVVKSLPKVPIISKSVKNSRKNSRKKSENRAEIGHRQLRTRKFIFAEQIAATSRRTVLDKKAQPSKNNIATKFVKNKQMKSELVSLKRRLEMKLELENRRTIKKDEVQPKQEPNRAVKVSDKTGKLAHKKYVQTATEPSHDDVILVSAKKKVIIINVDDDEGNLKSDFLVKTEIKTEIVTPDKTEIVTPDKTATVKTVQKRRKRLGRKRIQKLRLISEVKHKVGKEIRSFPLPIVSVVDNKVDLEVKTEKMDSEEAAVHGVCGIVSIKKEGTEEYSEGDMVWAKVGCHPYWPAMITRDPLKNSIKQTIISKNPVPYYHVRYFADNGRRSWVRATALLQYENRDDLDVLLKSSAKKLGVSKKYKVPKTKFKLWTTALEELESIKTHTLPDKLNFFIKASIRSAKKKRNASPRSKGIKRDKPGDFFDDSPTNISYKTLSSTRRIPIPIPEVKTPTTSRARLSSIDLSNNSPRSHIDRFLQTQFDDKMSCKKLRTRSTDDDKSDGGDFHKLKDFDSTDCSSSEADSIQNKVPLAGPIPCSIDYQELLHKRHNLFRKISRDKVCEICFKPANVLSCKGPCNGFYHLDCANGYLEDSIKTGDDKLSSKSFKNTPLTRLRRSRGHFDECNSGNSSDADSKRSLKQKKSSKSALNSFICGSCDRNEHYLCFVCLKEVSPAGDPDITKCKITKCGKAFHQGCTRLWPQAQWLTKPTNTDTDITSIICPRHVCHICVSDDPKAASARACRSEALVRCLLCPATYHSVTGCIPAGTEIYTHSQIICPRHLTLPNTGILSSGSGNVLDTAQINTLTQQEYFTKPLPPINTTWCFICSSGGDLVCCETCPTSLHEACSPINWLDDGSYICEDCETGRLILHDEVVWAKLGAYRWWPALVLYPKDVPPNIRTMRHRRGEFVIKFFGSYDHYWMGHGRVFLYQEGDKGATSSKNSKRVDVAFAKAIEEAAKAFALKRDFKKSLLQSESRQPKSLKPPAYIKIRFNKPVGNVKVYDGNVSITTPCSCDPNSESPCGPNTNCINRLLWTECNPRNCPAGDRCQNQLFETRKYPPLVPYKTDGRGWGLKTLVPIFSGQFLIEYVGEVIEEQEYKRRIENMQNQSEHNYYFLTIDSDRIIDAGPKGNMARFMNHSCNPNCETQKWTVNGDTRVGLFASETIPANKELTFNYNLATNGKTFLECKCKAAACSGFIGVKKVADNPKAKVIPEKVFLKRKRRLAKSRKLKVKNLLHKMCFICGKSDKLICCSNSTCRETYHIKCVNLINNPHANWSCPRHYCNVCRKKIVKRCKLCIKSYCTQHCNVKLQGKIVEFTCSDHTIASKSAGEELNGRKNTESTKKVDEIVKTELFEDPPSAAAAMKPKQQEGTKIIRRNRKVQSKPVKNLENTLSSRNNDKQRRKRQPKITVPSKRQLRCTR